MQRLLAGSPPQSAAFDLDFDDTAILQGESGAEMNLAHEFEIGFAVKLAGADFMGIWADDDGFVAGDQAALKFDGLSEIGLPVEGIFMGEDESVGRDDVVLGERDIQSAADETREPDARLN